CALTLFSPEAGEKIRKEASFTQGVESLRIAILGFPGVFQHPAREQCGASLRLVLIRKQDSATERFDFRSVMKPSGMFGRAALGWRARTARGCKSRHSQRPADPSPGPTAPTPGVHDGCGASFHPERSASRQAIARYGWSPHQLECRARYGIRC